MVFQEHRKNHFQDQCRLLSSFGACMGRPLAEECGRGALKLLKTLVRLQSEQFGCIDRRRSRTNKTVEVLVTSAGEKKPEGRMLGDDPGTKSE